MILNKIISWNRLPLLGLAFILLNNTSCIDLSDNINPNEVTEDMMSRDNLKTGSFFAQMLRNVVIFKDGSNLDSDYQIGQGMSGDIYSGYIAPTYAGYSGRHNGSYAFIAGWLNMIFKTGFTNIMSPWKSIVEIADEQGLSEVRALATIVKVEAMHRVADTYGPIPYCSFGSSSNTYDGLDEIYQQFFDELDESIDVLTDYVHGNANASIMADYDLMYGGDATKWVKFANTLRLRLAMRVYYANPALAESEARKSVENTIGFIENRNERAELQHSSSLIYHHPLYEIANNFNNGEARMSASMDSYLNGYNDPRRAAYFKPAEDGAFHGVRLGITPGNWNAYSGNSISNLNMDNTTTPIVWMTAAESYFLRAEGALRGWSMGGTAKDFYNQGIQVSFEENGVSGVDNYISDAVSQPAAFEDAVGSDNMSASSNITIAWDETANVEVNLERIITQKWIAMYPDGPEGWAEYRRTGYPKLFPVVVNNSNNTINTDLQIRRLPYPEDEYNNNETGVLTGVAKLGGQDNGGTKLWWDKKNRN